MLINKTKERAIKIGILLYGATMEEGEERTMESNVPFATK